MKHNEYKKWLQLLMYDELTTDEHAALDMHLNECSTCREELEDLKRFHSALLRAGAFVPGEDLLNEARQELRTSLLNKRRVSLWDQISDLTTGFLPDYRVALGAVTLLLIGIAIGRLVTPLAQKPTVTEEPRTVTTSLDGDTRFANVRFVDSDASDGEVEFSFDAISSVHIRGSINDDRVQKVLVHALVNDRNPGVRLRSVNAFATRAQGLESPDKEVRAALILALKTDQNPGVRKEALETLQGFPFDEEIKQAFLHVLMRDDNPALRIAAINSLDSTVVRGQQPDKELIEVLRQRMNSDNNEYVRIRAKATLEEAKLQ